MVKNNGFPGCRPSVSNNFYDAEEDEIPPNHSKSSGERHDGGEYILRTVPAFFSLFIVFIPYNAFRSVNFFSILKVT